MNTEQNTLKEKVAKSLESIRPSLQADGGDVELVNVVINGAQGIGDVISAIVDNGIAMYLHYALCFPRLLWKTFYHN